MTEDAPHYHSRYLIDWMRGIHEGRITLPTFRPGCVWDIGKAKSLIDSLFRNRPVGTLLLMSTDEERFHSRPIPGAVAATPAAGNGELILDGQQRLSALWRAFHDEPEPLFVRINDWAADSLAVLEVGSAADLRLRFAKDEDADAALLFESRCIPFAVLGVDCVTQSEGATWDWCDRALPKDGDRARRLAFRIQRDVAGPFRYRGLWHLTLPSGISKEEAIEMYIRANESSTVTRTRQSCGESLSQVHRGARE